ncbi:hypothetical protein ABW19_dt0204359 [Dactylella cylindrospora]|nr:hypothetical protein ABW19_dt0204359 [Dactylella cylindrospora]
MKSEEELEALVNQLAIDSKIDLQEWPDVLDYMLKRLDWIAHNSFPLPKPPPLLSPTKPPVSISRESTLLIQPPDELDSQDPNSQAEPATENQDATQNPPSGDAIVTDPPAATVNVEATQSEPSIQVPASSEEPPAGSLVSTQSTTIPSTEPPAETSAATQSNGGSPEEKFIPPTLQSSLASAVQTLTASFSQAPPHTIQRFAELILKPTKHYRSLAKFLRAVHRVISVTSGLDKFPLPITHDGQTASNAIPIGSGLVNDTEEISGATLTPIPWASAKEYVAAHADAAGSPLSDEGAASLIVDEGNGISQGELLRKEQEAGIVPMSQAGGPLENSGNSPLDEHHVSGPPELGPADVGPQPEGTVFGEKPSGDGNAKEDEMDVDTKGEEATASKKDSDEASS